MLDDFFVRALLAGAGVALIAGPLGCVVVWRRLSYFGDTLSHAALLGVALALLLNVNFIVSVFVVSVILSAILIVLEKKKLFSSDAVLGLLSHATLAIGLLALSIMTWVRVDLLSLLFGDILAVSKTDLAIIYSGGIVILACIWAIWRPLVAATLSDDIAAVEGSKPERTRLIFMLALASTIAIAMKIVGVLLITALLIIPAAAARTLSRSPEQMAVLSMIFGVLSVFGGLFGSLQFDTPSGPTIVVASLITFILAQFFPRLASRTKSRG